MKIIKYLSVLGGLWPLISHIMAAYEDGVLTGEEKHALVMEAVDDLLNGLLPSLNLGADAETLRKWVDFLIPIFVSVYNKSGFFHKK